MRRWYVGAIVACLTVFAKLRMIVLSIALAAAQLQHHVAGVSERSEVKVKRGRIQFSKGHTFEGLWR